MAGHGMARQGMICMTWPGMPWNDLTRSVMPGHRMPCHGMSWHTIVVDPRAFPPVAVRCHGRFHWHYRPLPSTAVSVAVYGRRHSTAIDCRETGTNARGFHTNTSSRAKSDLVVFFVEVGQLDKASLDLDVAPSEIRGSLDSCGSEDALVKASQRDQQQSIANQYAINMIPTYLHTLVNICIY